MENLTNNINKLFCDITSTKANPKRKEFASLLETYHHVVFCAEFMEEKLDFIAECEDMLLCEAFKAKYKMVDIINKYIDLSYYGLECYDIDNDTRENLVEHLYDRYVKHINMDYEELED